MAYWVLIGLAACCLSCEAFWQTQTSTDSYSDLGLYVRQTSDGGYVLVGETYSFGADDSDVRLIKADTDGSEQWNRTFGGTEVDWGYTVHQTTDGGYVLVGSTSSFGAGNSDVWLIRTDSSGAMQWSRTFGSSGDDFGHFIQQTDDGGYVIAGQTFNTGTETDNLYLIKTDGLGNELWARSFGDSTCALGYAVCQAADGGYVVTGLIDSLCIGQRRVWLIKTDQEGIKQWDRVFAAGNSAVGRSVQQTSDRGYVLAGFLAYADGSYDAWFIKTDSLGNLHWDRIFGGSGDDRAAAVQQTRDGGYIIVGLTQSFGAGLNDVWLIKTDNVGLQQWSRTFGGSSWDVGRSVQQTTDGGYIIAGTTQSFGAGDADFWLIKTDASGTEEWNQTFGGSNGD